MKHNTMLTVASLLSILFLTLHITDDIVRGISKAESSNTALLVLAVFLYGTLVLAERRSGHVIMLRWSRFVSAEHRVSAPTITRFVSSSRGGTARSRGSRSAGMTSGQDVWRGP